VCFITLGDHFFKCLSCALMTHQRYFPGEGDHMDLLIVYMSLSYKSRSFICSAVNWGELKRAENLVSARHGAVCAGYDCIDGQACAMHEVARRVAERAVAHSPG